MNRDDLLKIADAAGLPEALADRLRGDTPDEVAKDAAALVAALPDRCALEPGAARPRLPMMPSTPSTSRPTTEPQNERNHTVNVSVAEYRARKTSKIDLNPPEVIGLRLSDLAALVGALRDAGLPVGAGI